MPIEIKHLTISKVEDTYVYFKDVLGAIHRDKVHKSKMEALTKYKEEIINEHDIFIYNINRLIRESR